MGRGIFGANLETYQVWAHFKALNKGVLLVPLDSIQGTLMLDSILSVFKFVSAKIITLLCSFIYPINSDQFLREIFCFWNIH